MNDDGVIVAALTDSLNVPLTLALDAHAGGAVRRRRPTGSSAASCPTERRVEDQVDPVALVVERVGRERPGGAAAVDAVAAVDAARDGARSGELVTPRY